MGRPSLANAYRRPVSLDRPEAPQQTSRRHATLLPPTRWLWWYGLVGYVAAHALDFGIGEARRSLLGVHFAFAAGAVELDLCMIAVVFAFTRLRGGTPTASELGFRMTRLRPALGWAVLFLIATGVFQAGVIQTAHPLRGLDPLAHSPHGGIAGALVILVAAVIVPVCEEVFYRGFLYRTLRIRFAVFPAAMAGGLLFGAAHWLYAGYPAWQALVIAFDGVLWCLLYEHTGSLWPGIAIHSFMDGVGAEVQVTGTATIGLLIAAALAIVALIEPGGDRGTPIGLSADH